MRNTRSGAGAEYFYSITLQILILREEMKYRTHTKVISKMLF